SNRRMKMTIQNLNWLLPVLEAGWELSPIYAIFLLTLTLSSISRLSAYAVDRRKHFYPFLAASLVSAMTLSFWEVLLYAFGRMPGQLRIGYPSTPWNLLIVL